MNLIKKDTEKITREKVSDKHEMRSCIVPVGKGLLSNGSEHQKPKERQKGYNSIFCKNLREVCKQGDLQINDKKG